MGNNTILYTATPSVTILPSSLMTSWVPAQSRTVAGSTETCSRTATNANCCISSKQNIPGTKGVQGSEADRPARQLEGQRKLAQRQTELQSLQWNKEHQK